MFILRAPNAEQVPSGEGGVRCSLRVPARSGREEEGWQSEGSSFRSSLPPHATENFPGPLAMARGVAEGSSCRGLDVFGRRLSCGVEGRLVDGGKRRSVAFGVDEDDRDPKRTPRHYHQKMTYPWISSTLLSCLPPFQAHAFRTCHIRKRGHGMM